MSPQEEEYTILPESTDVHIQQHIHQKDLNLCLTWYGYDKVINEFEKTQNKEFSCVMAFIMRLSNTFIFASGFNECPWTLFSLHYWIWENFWFYIWVLVVWFLILRHKWLWVISYPMVMKKNLSAKTTNYIPKCWERSVIKKSNLNFIRAI